MPDEHRYSGEIHAPRGLKAATKILAACSWRIEARKSGYDGTLYLHSRDEQIDLEMESGQGPGFLFSGGVDGSEDLSRKLLGEFSRLLSGAGVVHRVELHRVGGDEVIAYWHHEWPQGQGEPAKAG